MALLHLMPERWPAPIIVAMSMVRKHPWKIAAAMLACGYIRRHWLRSKALCASSSSSSRCVVAELAAPEEAHEKRDHVEAVDDPIAQGNESFAGSGKLENDTVNIGLENVEKDGDVVTVTEEVIKHVVAESAGGDPPKTRPAAIPDDFESEACSLADLQRRDIAKAELRSQLEEASANAAPVVVRPGPRGAPSVTMGSVVVTSPGVRAPPKKNLTMPHQARAARHRRFTSATGTPYSCMSLASTPGCVTPA